MLQPVDRCDYTPGQCIDGRYTVTKVLGEGTYGKVYSVTDYSGVQYALKILRLWEVPSEIREPLMLRFEMEFRTGQIECDNLVRAVQCGKVGGNPYIVMEFCPGGDLEPLIGTGNPQIPAICRDILYGLNALHKNAKVHRDLKPENVLLKQDGKAALTDFGIAGDRNHRLTQKNFFGKPQEIFGTYAYMPPEQVNRARGEATVLPTTDIWSFGVLAYQLLTGSLPFGTLESHNDLAMYQKRGKEGDWSRSRLAAIPYGNQWAKVIDGCLVPDYKKRFQSVEEVLRYMPESSTVRPQPQVGYRPPQFVSGFSLHIMYGEDYGKIYRLTELVAEKNTRVLTMGRQWDNCIFVRETNSSLISRYHCTIEQGNTPSEWIIRDGQWNMNERQWRDSTNGTYVNATRVSSQGFYLSVGDIITIGDTKLRFENY